MNLNIEPIKNWFGFSRRERRSSFILIIIIVVIIVLRYTLPDSKLKVTDITGKPVSVEELALSSGTKTSFYKGSSAKEPVRKQYYKQEKSGFDKRNRGPAVVTTRSEGKFMKNDPGIQRALIDINTSDSATLVSLPGIGPVLSARIIKYRRLLGGYARIEQMKEVYGLPPETYNMIKDRITADTSGIIKVNINSADYKGLSHIHYFEKYEITAIMKYRQLNGKINNIVDLTDNKLISLEKAIKVRPYLKFD
jgi:DNA uptake protein ComE-like DNA-binding protein